MADKSYLPGNIPGEVAVGIIFEMAVVTSVMIDDVHFSVVVNPQLANNDVVYCSGYFAPSVMITTFREYKVGDSWSSQRRFVIID